MPTDEYTGKDMRVSADRKSALFFPSPGAGLLETEVPLTRAKNTSPIDGVCTGCFINDVFVSSAYGTRKYCDRSVMGCSRSEGWIAANLQD